MARQIKPVFSNGPGWLYPAMITCRWRSRQESNKRSCKINLITIDRTGNL